MEVRIVRLTDYVDVELSGQVDLTSLLELISRLGDMTRANADQRLLFDLLALDDSPHIAGQMQVGEQVAHCLAHLARVASVVPPDKITRTSEQVARAQGVQLKIFESKDEAIAWLRGGGDGVADTSVPAQLAAQAANAPRPLGTACTAIWLAVRHLFPAHAQAIQLPNGSLAISWAIANQPQAVFEMATPITVRLEPELAESLRLANPEQRKRIAAHQEAAFRAGLVGYDPFTTVPKARVIVLG